MPKAVCAIALAVATLALAACGSGKEQAAPPAPAAPRDPGREVMTVFVAAAAEGDTQTMWNLLSAPSQRRAGPTLEDFAKDEARRLRRQLAPFAGRRLPVSVSERIDHRFGLVALARGKHTFAVPLRLSNRLWRVELPGPVRMDILGPPPGSRGKFLNQVAVEVHGRGSGVSVLYVDGITLDTKGASGPVSATVYANFATPLERGRHTAVAFATRGANATAKAWTFVV